MSDLSELPKAVELGNLLSVSLFEYTTAQRGELEVVVAASIHSWRVGGSFRRSLWPCNFGRFIVFALQGDSDV